MQMDGRFKSSGMQKIANKITNRKGHSFRSSTSIKPAIIGEKHANKIASILGDHDQTSAVKRSNSIWKKNKHDESDSEDGQQQKKRMMTSKHVDSSNTLTTKSKKEMPINEERKAEKKADKDQVSGKTMNIKRIEGDENKIINQSKMLNDHKENVQGMLMTHAQELEKNQTNFLDSLKHCIQNGNDKILGEMQKLIGARGDFAVGQNNLHEELSAFIHEGNNQLLLALRKLNEEALTKMKEELVKENKDFIKATLDEFIISLKKEIVINNSSYGTEIILPNQPTKRRSNKLIGPSNTPLKKSRINEVKGNAENKATNANDHQNEQREEGGEDIKPIISEIDQMIQALTEAGSTQPVKPQIDDKNKKDKSPAGGKKAKKEYILRHRKICSTISPSKLPKVCKESKYYESPMPVSKVKKATTRKRGCRK